jgi:hypothetical protein
MSYRLGGRNALPYMGVEPATPPDLVVIRRAPTPNDSQNFNIGTLWVVPEPPGPEEIWMLVSLAAGVATWVQLYPNGGSGASEFIEDTGIANQSGGILNVVGGTSTAGKNIHTFGSGNTVQVILNDSLLFPNTTNDGSEGVLFWGGDRFVNNYGTNNTFVGSNAGNLTLTTGSAVANSGFGNRVLQSLTTGNNNTSAGNLSMNGATEAQRNCSYGAQSLQGLTTGNDNCSMGQSSLLFLQNGARNISVGTQSGGQYTSSETGNIVLNNIGVTGESGSIRIGNSTDNISSTYIAGIFGADVDTGTAEPVFIDSTGKLGSSGGGTPTGSDAFLAYQNGNYTLSSGSNNYNLGTSLALSIIYDHGSNVFVGSGSGSPATFTAPITGEYILLLTVTFSGSQNVTWQNSIVTTGRTYADKFLTTNVGSTNPTFGCLQTTVIADMTSGDTAVFNVNLTTSASGNTLTGGTSSAPTVFISGYLIQ